MTGVTVTDPSSVDHVDTVSFNYTIPGTHALNVGDPHDLASGPMTNE